MSERTIRALTARAGFIAGTLAALVLAACTPVVDAPVTLPGSAPTATQPEPPTDPRS